VWRKTKGTDKKECVPTLDLGKKKKMKREIVSSRERERER
jgi:hypothetical protein